MPEMLPIDVDAAVTRLFALLGVPLPTEGSVVFDFHEARLMKVRPTSVITVRRDKALHNEKVLATEKNSEHTRR